VKLGSRWRKSNPWNLKPMVAPAVLLARLRQARLTDAEEAREQGIGRSGVPGLNCAQRPARRL